jgi:uncharacterized protein (DUF885 family)
MARDFVPLAEQIADQLLNADPVLAHWAGDHRGDAQLPDFGPESVRRQLADLRQAADVLAEVDPEELAPAEAVDLELLTAAVEARKFALGELREHEWNPLTHNPGFLLHGLLYRETAPASDRLASLVGRLRQLPESLAAADLLLTDCPAPHLETALTQLDGTEALIRDEVPRFAAELKSVAAVNDAVAGALAAVGDHRARLLKLAGSPGRDPRLGARLWEAKLWHSLDSEITAGQLATRAEENLRRVLEEMAEVTAELTGNRDIRAALETLSAEHPDNHTITGVAAEALRKATEFVVDHNLVSLVEDPCEIIEMPEFARGVAVAYCDAPGPLETAEVSTFYAISPTPAEWDPDRVKSFYREYNNHMVANLTVHEAMPGHYLQLARARRFRGSSRVRALCASGSFVEGWAVYAEEMMAKAGYGGLPVRLQQLKLQLRMTINALIDRGVHCEEMTESEALKLMTTRGFQEEREAAGKWRRALLTSGQLSTYFVGWSEVSAIARARPSGYSHRQWHDEMLAHGSPSPRHLATLLGVNSDPRGRRE